ncbi:MAG: terpene cyclase/mutase family protein [Kiritimatiellae bacterium]|nr:terpene cyclase/mutase family protein [Kiritimatiellia bacterium]
MTNPSELKTAEAEASPAKPARAIDYHLQRIKDHLWGPTGSVILHIIIIIVLLNIVVMPVRQEAAEIEVVVMEPDAKDLEKLEQKLEEIKDLEIDIETPDAEVDIETPEMETFQNAPVAEELAALDIKTDAMSPLIMKGLFSGRSASGRAGLLRRFNPRHGEATEKAVMNALRWLKKNQRPDGSWEGNSTANNAVAMSGIALLAFLSHGETHQSEEFGETVRKAIDFIRAQQQPDGSFFSNRMKGGHQRVYGNGIAAYAMSEAYALTRIPDLREVMEKAITFILNGMQSTGGFDYEYAKGKSPREGATTEARDTSVAGFQAQAVKAAYIVGADVPGLKEKMATIANGFRMNYLPDQQRFAYAPPASGGPTIACTAIGTLCLQLLGYPSDERVTGALKGLQDVRCNWDEPGMGNHPMYAWYYMSQAKFHSKTATHFTHWNDSYAPAMISHQNQDGSWTPAWGSERGYGPVYGTAFGAVSLMVYYRFLPTYQEIKEEEAPTETQEDDIVIEIG